MHGVSISTILETRYKRKDNTYAVKLRVTYQRQQKFYPISHLTKEDWAKVQGERPRGQYGEWRDMFRGIEAKALDIVKKLEPFSFEAFEKRYNRNKINRKDALELIQEYVDQLNEEKRSGTAYSYKTALVSIKKFVKETGRKKLPLTAVTPDWLQAYEDWMLKEGKSVTTIGIYLRSFRTILNIGIEEGSLLQEQYPFGKRKYQIPAGRNVKKALTLADIKKIVEYKPKDKYESRARDLWLFSYLCNGINVKDIALLRYGFIDKDSIQFIRSKTQRSARQDQKPIVVSLLPEAKAIIKRWGLKPKKPENLVFDLISEDAGHEKQAAQIRQAAKMINKYMDRIRKACKIEMKVTTYTARHSFATVLKRSGASTELISESLGHKDLKTTENYLDSFESKVKREFQKSLLKFDE